MRVIFIYYRLENFGLAWGSGIPVDASWMDENRLGKSSGEKNGGGGREPFALTPVRSHCVENVCAMSARDRGWKKELTVGKLSVLLLSDR